MLLSNITNSQQNNGKLSYDYSFGFNIEETNAALQKIFSETDTKVDSLEAQQNEEAKKFIAAFTEALDSKVSEGINNSEQKTHDIYVYQDTVAVQSPEDDIVMIQSTLHAYYNRKIRDKFYSWNRSMVDSLNNWTAKYDIIENKNDSIEVLGLKAHKMKITEKRTVSSGEVYTDVCELYVSDKVDFSFNFYDFLGLKKSINKFGLILYAKCYDPETPNNSLNYKLIDYNTDIQDKQPLRDFDFKPSRKK